MLSRLANRILAPLSLRITRRPYNRFERLRTATRRTRGEISLHGKPFEYIDEASFLHSYREIFLDRIYDFPCESSSPRVVDLGANIGLSTLFFKQLYPDSAVTSVEADPAIFPVLQSNVAAAGVGNVELHHTAIHSDSQTLDFVQEGADAGRIALPEDYDAECKMIQVQCRPIDAFLEQPVDFLKVDIEGVETEAFEQCSRLDQVAAIFVEYHSFQTQAQSLPRLLDKLTGNGFRYAIRDQFCTERPLRDRRTYSGMDLALNIWAYR
ncbi:MAG: FkbM family methyltransferase [Planctomycetota bacterium]